MCSQAWLCTKSVVFPNHSVFILYPTYEGRLHSGGVSTWDPTCTCTWRPTRVHGFNLPVHFFPWPLCSNQFWERLQPTDHNLRHSARGQALTERGQRQGERKSQQFPQFSPKTFSTSQNQGECSVQENAGKEWASASCPSSWQMVLKYTVSGNLPWVAHSHRWRLYP